MANNVHGHTVDRLGEAIDGGRDPAGGAIPPEPLLCDEFGISRTVAREAVKSLVAKGLPVTGPKVGIRVLPEDNWNWFDPDVVMWETRAGLSREYLRDLLGLRRVVEPAGVRVAAVRATAQDVADIEAAYAGMEHAIEHGGDYVSNDLRFHQGLLRACHNQIGADGQGTGCAAAHQLRDQHHTPRRAGPCAAVATCGAGRGDCT